MLRPARLVRFGRALPAVLGVSPLLVLGIVAAWLASRGSDSATVVADPTQEALLGISAPLQQLLLATLPLVAATATVVYAWREGWIASESLGVAQVALIVVCYFAIARLLDWQSAVEPLALLPAGDGVLGMMARAVNDLAGSVVHYGVWRFGGGVLTGVVLGYVWHDRVGKLKSAWHGSQMAKPHHAGSSS